MNKKSRLFYVIFFVLVILLITGCGTNETIPNQTRQKIQKAGQTQTKQQNTDERSIARADKLPQTIDELERGLADSLGFDDMEQFFEYMDSLSEEQLDGLMMDYLGFESPQEVDTFMAQLEGGDNIPPDNNGQVDNRPTALPDNIPNEGGQVSDNNIPPTALPTVNISPPTDNNSVVQVVDIGAVPANSAPEIDNIFSKYTALIAPNGKLIEIFAQDGVTDEQMIRSRSILAFYLTNVPGSQYGADKIAVANSMANNKAILLLLNGSDSGIPPDINGQPLYADEMPIEGSPAYINNDYENHRDASFEEIFHLLHDTGIGTDTPQSQPGALPAYQAEIRAATTNALNNNLWATNPEEATWLLSLKQEGSLTQEYIVSVIDSYYGMWGAFTENPGGMWGIYVAKHRSDIQAKDTQGYALLAKFFSPYLTYNARIDSSFNGVFSLTFDPATPYTYKSQYLLNATLTGNNGAGLIGNDQNNRLAGNAGDNSIDGRNGTDTVLFKGKRAEYTISKDGNVITVVDTVGSRDGSDSLLNIEQMQFSDQTVNRVDIK